MRVAIQGIEGSFHQQAAIDMLGSDISLVPCPTFQQVFDAVLSEEADYGVVAVENSLHGSINDVYRLLANQHVWVSKETFLKIEQYLIGNRPLEVTHIERVLSQEPAIAQCEQWLAAHAPQAIIEMTHDTADSVRTVLAHPKAAYAAIASKKAAEQYGGTILAGRINDNMHNYTRFFLISKDRATVDDADRTSVILQTNHLPGALWRALGVFVEAEINLSKLDSHPIAGDRRHYRFYVDFDAGMQEERSKSLIETLRLQGCSVHVLGSYKAGNR